MGFRYGLFAFTAAVLGGIGNLAGAVLGGFMIGIIWSFSDGFMGNYFVAGGASGPTPSSSASSSWCLSSGPPVCLAKRYRTRSDDTAGGW